MKKKMRWVTILALIPLFFGMIALLAASENAPTSRAMWVLLGGILAHCITLATYITVFVLNNNWWKSREEFNKSKEVFYKNAEIYDEALMILRKNIIKEARQKSESDAVGFAWYREGYKGGRKFKEQLESEYQKFKEAKLKDNG